MERWWCTDCRVPVELNKHARCGHCDSEAVDAMERTGKKVKPVPAALAPFSTRRVEFSGDRVAFPAANESVERSCTQPT